jgi:L-lactate transport
MTTQWIQNYAAVGNSIGLTALVATIPIIFLFWALAIKRMKGHYAGLGALGLTILVAIFVYQMPATLALSSTLYGMLYGLFPVGWIVVTAVFLYNLTVEAGQFDIIKNSIASLTDDRRLQALLIAFGFGAFLEGAAGFGAPVAISGAILIGLGFNPLYAAGLCLIANTAPVAFGAIGIPIITAGQVTGISDVLISQAVGRQLPFLSLIIPLYLVMIMGGWKAAKEVLPAIMVTGISFAALQFATSQMGPMLPDIVSSLGSILSLAIFLKFWKPANVWRFPDEAKIVEKTKLEYTTAQVVKAWSPFAVLTVLVGIWGLPAFKNWVAKSLQWFVSIKWPGLYDAAGNPIIYKNTPIVANVTKGAYTAVYKWDFFAAAGTAILITAVITAVILGIGPARFLRIFGKTFKQLAFPLTTISAVLGFAYIANYSGLSYTLGLAFAGTGKAFPFLSPFLGWLAVFLTGSDTSANALFGKLQQVTAEQVGVNPVLTVAANSSGGVCGKMISPQSIAVATASVGLVGKEADLFRFTVKHSLILVTAIGVITFLQAYVFTWMIPVIK